jgi:6-pyruvoyl-tetrahydropterin synthase
MSRWIVHASADFTARHALSSYLGSPEKPHNHLWKVAVRATSQQLNHEGYSLDFHALHRLLDEAVAPLEDLDLSSHPRIGSPTPSAERLAEVLAEILAPRVTDLGGTLISVSVWEGPDNRVDLEL